MLWRSERISVLGEFQSMVLFPFLKWTLLENLVWPCVHVVNDLI